ncbi:hypothetical protein E4U21_005142 [Claviceps maximensis]|nr:hypothetical protein E4U21_005142 [Claviceps maximensis]
MGVKAKAKAKAEAEAEAEGEAEGGKRNAHTSSRTKFYSHTCSFVEVLVQEAEGSDDPSGPLIGGVVQGRWAAKSTSAAGGHSEVVTLESVKFSMDSSRGFVPFIEPRRRSSFTRQDYILPPREDV